MAELERNLRRWVLVAAAGLVAAALLLVSVSGIRTWRAKSQTLACMSKAKAIWAAMLTYSNCWDGWMAPGPDGYVKMAGYKLKGEQGYDAVTAGKVETFRCPADRNPKKIVHGYLSSYRTMECSRLGDMWAVSEVWSVYEKGKRHPYEGRLAAVYVYWDGHVELASAKSFPGINLAIWRLAPGIWESVKKGPPAVPPDYEDDWWFGGLSLTGGTSESLHGFVGTESDARGASALADRILAQLEGAISFPEAGDWEFVLKYARQVCLWVDANRNGLVDPQEVVERLATVKYEECTLRCGKFVTGAPYRFRFLFTRHRGDLPTSVWWVTPQGRREEIPTSVFSHELN